jgi:hypothetical protein
MDLPKKLYYQQEGLRKMLKYRIGYIDEDASEVKILQRKLREHDIEVIGYEFTQGMTKEELLKQVYSSDIDLLLIDYKLKGQLVTFNGEEIESDIYEKKPRFPYIIFTSDPSHAEGFIEDWKSIYNKNELFSHDEAKNEKFIRIIIKSIEQYRNFVHRKKSELSFLLKKGEQEGLEVVEQHTMLSLQRELMSLDTTTAKELPEQLASYQKVESLSKVRKNAEDFLKSLIESDSENES